MRGLARSMALAFAAVLSCTPFGKDESTSDGGTSARPSGDDCLALGPAAFYRFDEGSGETVHDASGNGNDGILHNGPAWIDGQSGRALSFDGVDDYVDIPSSPSLDVSGSTISIMFWMLVEDVARTGDGVVLSKAWDPDMSTSSFYQYGIEMDSNASRDLDLYFGDGSGTKGPFKMHPTFGRWTHVAFTYDGGTVRGYIDGASQLETTASALTIGSRANPLRIGVDGRLDQPFKGALDGICIVPRTVSPEEVARVAKAR